VKFWQYGDITYPVNVLPAVHYSNNGYPLPVMLPNNHTTAAPQTGHYANLATPETLQQQINPHHYNQGCKYPPYILPFHHPVSQFVSHENQLYPFLHGNSIPAQENAPHTAQNVQFKDPIHSQHLTPPVNNFSFARQPRDFRLGSIDCCDTFLIENRKSGVSGYASASFKECALSHPLGNIIKTKRAVHCHFILDSGAQWYNIRNWFYYRFRLMSNFILFSYLTISPSKIKFSSKRTGISYLIDEAGVRTCLETFLPLKKVAEETWERNAALVKNSNLNLKGNGLPRGSKGKITWHAVAGNQPIM
jgi:hypothetical protein